ncbi:hypothetical protein RDABS01_035758 [Bienertia sinuspersici]
MAKLSDIQNPFYLHPLDDVNSITLSKLVGPVNYREWKRAVEISLASNKKLGFVIGTMTGDTPDESNADLIKKSVMNLSITYDIWKQLGIGF